MLGAKLPTPNHAAIIRSRGLNEELEIFAMEVGGLAARIVNNLEHVVDRIVRLDAAAPHSKATHAHCDLGAQEAVERAARAMTIGVKLIGTNGRSAIIEAVHPRRGSVPRLSKLAVLLKNSGRGSKACAPIARPGSAGGKIASGAGARQQTLARRAEGRSVANGLFLPSGLAPSSKLAVDASGGAYAPVNWGSPGHARLRAL